MAHDWDKIAGKLRAEGKLGKGTRKRGRPAKGPKGSGDYLLEKRRQRIRIRARPR
jgi:hypothetical protein